MYVYHGYYSAKKVALVYPSPINIEATKSNYYRTNGEMLDENECSIISIAVPKQDEKKLVSIKDWQKQIADKLFNY